MRQCLKYFVVITAFLGLMMGTISKVKAVDDGDCECVETGTAPKTCTVIPADDKCSAGATAGTMPLKATCIINADSSCNRFILGEGTCACRGTDFEVDALRDTQTPFGKSSLYNPRCGGSSSSAIDAIKTPLGCIPVDLGLFSNWARDRLLPILALVCFCLLIYGFIVIGTSEGDPKKLQLGKEVIISAISGLFIAIFGVYLIRFLLKDLIKLPGSDGYGF